MTMRTRKVQLLRQPTFESLFMTHLSQVGSTSPWTLLAAMLRGSLCHPMCRQATTFCGGFERDSKVHRLGHLVFSQLLP